MEPCGTVASEMQGLDILLDSGPLGLYSNCGTSVHDSIPGEGLEVSQMPASRLPQLDSHQKAE